MVGIERSNTATWGIAVIALDGTILESDELYAEVNGVAAPDLVGRNINEFAETESGYSPASILSILLGTRQPVLTRRAYVSPAGRRTVCRVQLCLLEDADGEPCAVLAVVQPSGGPPG